MSNGMDWLLRPVHAGMCRFESLLDGTLDLADVADLNEFLDVQEENSIRRAVALSRKR